MSNEILRNVEFGEIRIIEDKGIIWFCGSDVAKALGYANPRKAIIDHCKKEGVTKCDTPTESGTQSMVYVNEPNLYRLVTHSKLPSAEKFERWIFEDVLPSIRKHGGYISGQENLTDEELLSKALLVAQNKILERDEKIKSLQGENSTLKVDNTIMKPKAEYFDELVDRNLLTNFRETAKQLKIKEKEFISFLLDKKYLYRDKSGKLTPYANKNNGLFELKECYNEKTSWTGTQTLITPKGRETFRLLCVGA